MSTNFLRPPKFGAGIVEVEEVRVGRSVASHRARLVEDGTSVLEMTVTSGTLPDDEPAWTQPPPELPPIEDCVPARRKAPTGVDVAIMDKVEVLFDPTRLPDPLTELTVSDEGRRRAVTVQVVQLLEDGVVRCVPMSPVAITARLRRASDLADLAPSRRLDAKLDMSPSGITRRLREASELLDLCRALANSRPAL